MTRCSSRPSQPCPGFFSMNFDTMCAQGKALIALFCSFSICFSFVATTNKPMSLSTNYVSREFIAGGRFSRVYKARETTGSGYVALKVTTPDEDRPPHNSRDEVRLLQELNKIQEDREESPSQTHIIRLLGTYVADLEDLVLVFPYFPLTLNRYLQNSATKIRPRWNAYASISEPAPSTELKNNITLENAKSIVLGIAEGLRFLHSNGVIHRDIKPENIMFQNFDPNPIIIDFGISYKYPTNYGKEQPEKKICEVSTGIYRAPELIFGISDYSYGIDIWSFGILISLIFSDNLEPVYDNDDYGDFRLASLIFKAFGNPSLETWPEAAKSSTFSRLTLVSSDPIDIQQIIPRADDLVREIFKRMMVYQSTDRLSAARICEILTEESL